MTKLPAAPPQDEAPQAACATLLAPRWAFAAAGCAFVSAGYLAVTIPKWQPLVHSLGIALPLVVQMQLHAPLAFPLLFLGLGASLLVLGHAERGPGTARVLGRGLARPLASFTLLAGVGLCAVNAVNLAGLQRLLRDAQPVPAEPLRDLLIRSSVAPFEIEPRRSAARADDEAFQATPADEARLVRALLRAGDLKGAEHVLTQGLNARPDDLGLRRRRLGVRLARGERDAAVEDLKALVAGPPESALEQLRLRTDLAFFAQEAGDHEGAHAIWERVLSDSVLLHRRRALRWRRDAFDDARLRRALARGARGDRAGAFQELGELGARGALLEDELARSKDLSPDHPERLELQRELADSGLDSLRQQLETLAAAGWISPEQAWLERELAGDPGAGAPALHWAIQKDMARQGKLLRGMHRTAVVSALAAQDHQLLPVRSARCPDPSGAGQELAEMWVLPDGRRLFFRASVLVTVDAGKANPPANTLFELRGGSGPQEAITAAIEVQPIGGTREHALAVDLDGRRLAAISPLDRRTLDQLQTALTELLQRDDAPLVRAEVKAPASVPLADVQRLLRALSAAALRDVSLETSPSRWTDTPR